QKFESWRKYQRQAVEFVVESDSKFTAIDAPTGIGKTLMGNSVMSLFGGKGYYLVGTKALQEQVVRDYPDVKVLKGRSNFKCRLFDVTCDQCPYSAINKECPEKDM
ncbi:unnamed protein product, partial [marine sediment metagenome]